MKIHYDLPHVEKYIKQQSHFRLEDLELQFANTIKRVNKFKKINSDTKILEVGTGTGGFQYYVKIWNIL
jgi:hypothetical protein